MAQLFLSTPKFILKSEESEGRVFTNADFPRLLVQLGRDPLENDLHQS